MEVVMVVLRPKQALASSEFRLGRYEILLLDSKTPVTDGARPGRYLPMFSTDSFEEESREQVLTEVFKITGGIKGERAVHVSWNHASSSLPTSHRESLSRFSLYCVPVNPQDKLSKRRADQGHSNPVFWPLDSVMEALNNGSIFFAPPTHAVLVHFESWLREKHSRPGVIDCLFWPHAEYRIHLTVHNPVFIPSRLPPEDSASNVPNEIQLTANEALAKMLSIEKCDIVIMNPLFGSGLPYNPKVNKVVINHSWPETPVYSEIPKSFNPVPTNGEPRWRDKYPLHASAAEGDVHQVERLLSQGFQHSKKDSISWAPIHYAAWYRSAEVVKMLLDAGSSPNLMNSERWTPLHMAAKKGFPEVAQQLVRASDVDLSLRDKDGKRALDICTSLPGRNSEHNQVANIIQGAQLRPSLTVEVQLMDKSVRHLKLVSGMQTTVQDINQQMLNEFKLPMKYSDIFTIWICSESLELQLKTDHRLMEELAKWRQRTVEMLTDAGPRGEEPVFKWRRNAKVSVKTEEQITNPKALDLLYHEAYHNYIKGLYPCKDSDAITFAALLFCIRYPGHASIMNKSFLTNVSILQELIPASMMQHKNLNHWASKIMKEYSSNLHGRDIPPQVLKRKFLSHCQHLTVYGSAFFTGTIRDRSTNVPCHVGVNDLGVHIINSQTKQMICSYKYTEISWELLLEKLALEIRVIRPPRNASRTITRIRTRQAGIIDNLMKKLKQLNMAPEDVFHV